MHLENKKGLKGIRKKLFFVILWLKGLFSLNNILVLSKKESDQEKIRFISKCPIKSTMFKKLFFNGLCVPVTNL